jgi:hypothetical protein
MVRISATRTTDIAHLGPLDVIMLTWCREATSLSTSETYTEPYIDGMKAVWTWCEVQELLTHEEWGRQVLQCGLATVFTQRPSLHTETGDNYTRWMALDSQLSSSSPLFLLQTSLVKQHWTTHTKETWTRIQTTRPRNQGSITGNV